MRRIVSGTTGASALTSGAAESRRLTGREQVLVATLCGAQVLEVLGVTVVIVALPVIGVDLGLERGRLQLVVSLYAVLYGALLLTAGRLADVVGRRAVLAAGLAVTAAGAVTCAVAGTGTVLLAGRAVQGLGGALVTPAALALLTTAFPAGRPRRTAISAWTAAAAGGGALGFGAGGVLVGTIGWRPVFWVLTVAAVVVLVAVRQVVPGSTRARGARRGIDVTGTVAAVSGLVLLVVGAGMVEEPGLVPAAAVLALGAVLLGVFVLAQRVGRDPLLGWSTLTNRDFLLANGVAFTNTATTSASGTLVALMAQDVLGLSPLSTGLVLLPFSVMVVVGSSAGGFWLQRPLRKGMAAGLAVVAVAMGGLAAATATRSVWLLVVAVALAGLGLSWAAVTSTQAATAALSAAQQGTAAGAVNTAAQIGTALGVATLLTVASAVDGATTSSGRGLSVAFLGAAGLAAAVAVSLAFRARGDRSTTVHR